MRLAALGARLDEISGRELDERTLSRVRLLLLNVFACAMEGRDAHDTGAALRAAAVLGGSGPATLWLTGERISLLEAAYANCASLHGSIKEDTHSDSESHPGTPVIPAVLAVAEHLNSSGAVAAKAIVVGIEAMGQVGRLASTTSFAERGWRHTAVFGAFGSAAASAVLLGLSGNPLVSAMALAGNVAGGLCAYKTSGTSDHTFANATGARNGVEAAFIASAGASGAPDLLEHPQGFLAAFGAGPLDSRTWPQTDELEIGQVYLKQHESASANQQSIEAASRIVRKRRVRPEEIRSVTVRTYKRATVKGRVNPGPFTGHYSAMVSGKFGVAAVLLDGSELSAERYRNYADPAITNLTSRISIELDPEAERMHPKVKISTVTVELVDGTRVQERVEDLPEIAFSDVAERFKRFAEPTIGRDNAGAIVEKVGTLEKLERISEITSLFQRQSGADRLRGRAV